MRFIRDFFGWVQSHPYVALRLAARYASGFIGSQGIVLDDDVKLFLAAMIAAFAEAGYAWAKRHGGAT